MIFLISVSIRYDLIAMKLTFVLDRMIILDLIALHVNPSGHTMRVRSLYNVLKSFMFVRTIFGSLTLLCFVEVSLGCVTN